MRFVINFLTWLAFNLIAFFGIALVIGEVFKGPDGERLMNSFLLLFFVFIGLPSFIVFLKKQFLNKPKH